MTTFKGLTIKFKGETRGLTSALREINKGASTTQRELKQVDKALKLDPSNVKLSERQIALLEDRIEKTAKQLELYKQAESEIGKENMSTDQWMKLQSDIAITEQRLQSYKRELAEVQIKQSAMQSVLGRSGLALEEWGIKHEATGRKIQTIGRTLTSTVTPAILAAGAASLKMAVDVDTSLTNVKKTVDGTEDQYQQLKAAALEFSQTNAVSASQILDIQSLGAQLGFAIDELQEFSQVVSGLDIATNMDAETAATEMAQFANITKMSHSEVSNYGSAIVGLGNNFATTEADISSMAMRLAAAGTQVGMSQADILGLATALTSMGMEAEAGGAAMSTIMSTIDKAVATNDKSLKEWASAAKMSASDFANAWKNDPVQALSALLSGMEAATAEGGNMSVILEELGVESLRQTDAMKRLAGNSEFVAKAVAKSNEEWRKNTALQNEVDNRNDSLAAKFQILQNRAIAIAEKVGGPLADALLAVIDAAEPLIQAISDGAQSFADMSEEEQRTVLAAVALSAALGPLLTGIGGGIMKIEDLGKGLQSLATFFAKVGGAAAPVAEGLSKNADAAMKLSSSAGKGAVGLGALRSGLIGITAAVILASIIALAMAIKDLVEYSEDLEKSTNGMRSTMGVAAQAAGVEAASLGKVAQSADNAIDSVDKLIDSQAKLADSMAERNSEAATSGAVLQSYADVVAELTGKTDLSEESQGRLKAAVDAINDACGTSYEVVQNQAGAFVIMADGAEQAVDAVLRVVDAQKAQIALEASKSNYEEAMKAKAEAAQTLAEAQEAYASKLAWAHEQEAAGVQLTQTQADEIILLEQKVKDAEAALNGVGDAERFANEQMTLYTMAMEEGSDAYTRFLSGNVSLQAGIEQSGQSLFTFRQQLLDTGIDVSAFADLNETQLVELGSSYDGTTSSIVNKLQQFGIDVGTAGAAAGASFSSGLSSEAQAAIDAAINTVGMTREEFDKLAAEAGIEGEEAAIAFANQIAAGQGDSQSAGRSLSDAAESGVDGTAGELGREGSNASSEFAEGVGSGKKDAKAQGAALADAAKTMKRDANQTYGWGSHLGSNFANGLSSTISLAKGAASSVANAIAGIFKHSVAKEGPLHNGGRGEKEWGRHGIQNYIEGMREAIPEMRKTAEEIAQINASAFGLSNNGSLDMPSLAQSTAGKENINIELKGGLSQKEMYEAMLAALEDVPSSEGDIYLDGRVIGRFIRGIVKGMVA